MEEKEQKTRENTTEENPVSAEPKLEVVEPAPVVEKKVENAGLPRSVKLAETEEVEPEIVEEVVFTTGETTENENAGLPHSSAIAPELAKTTIEEIPQTETSPITPDQEVEQSQTTPTQETPKKPQIRVK
jgi:hypothetical protein